jgi:hypothetical protein
MAMQPVIISAHAFLIARTYSMYPFHNDCSENDMVARAYVLHYVFDTAKTPAALKYPQTA